MKQKIINIIGFMEHPEKAELMAEQIMQIMIENKLGLAVADLLEADPHQFTSRPCQTCRAVTALIGRKFGCIKKA